MGDIFKTLTNSDILNFFKDDKILYMLFTAMLLYVGYKIYYNAATAKQTKNFINAIINLTKTVETNSQISEKTYTSMNDLKQDITDQRIQLIEAVTYCRAVNGQNYPEVKNLERKEE